ncbi:MAG: hypothetical protein RLZZ519_3247, partial [Bacteroidota bacterium]
MGFIGINLVEITEFLAVFEAEDKVVHEIYGRFDVVFVHHFDGRVHVAQGHGDER